MSRSQIVRYRCCEHCGEDGLHGDNLHNNHEVVCDVLECLVGKKAVVPDV